MIKIKHKFRIVKSPDAKYYIEEEKYTFFRKKPYWERLEGEVFDYFEYAWKDMQFGSVTEAVSYLRDTYTPPALDTVVRHILIYETGQLESFDGRPL